MHPRASQFHAYGPRRPPKPIYSANYLSLPMRIGVLFSGGKDSCFTTHYYQIQGWDVACLLSMRSENPDSFMFHTPNIGMVGLQAQALDIPLLQAPTQGEKEAELEDLRALLEGAKREFALDGAAVGALWSDYQQERVNRVCAAVGLKTFAPLWHKDQPRLLREILGLGFEVRLSAIAAEGLKHDWLGRRFDSDFLTVLEQLHETIGFHVGGEGGEYESLVLDGPNFRQRVIVEEAQTVKTGPHAGVWQVKRARLAAK